MANMTPQDAAMLKILQRRYGKSVYPTPGGAKSPGKKTGPLTKVIAKSPDQAKAQNKSMLEAKKKKK